MFDHYPGVLESRLINWGSIPFMSKNMLKHHLFKKCYQEWWESCRHHGVGKFQIHEETKVY